MPFVIRYPTQGDHHDSKDHQQNKNTGLSQRFRRHPAYLFCGRQRTRDQTIDRRDRGDWLRLTILFFG